MSVAEFNRPVYSPAVLRLRGQGFGRFNAISNWGERSAVQHDRSDGGFTDIELLAPELHVIVEAKIGWNPPSEAQLHRYEDRFAKTTAPAKRLVVLTQNGAERVGRLGDCFGAGLGSWTR